MKSILITVVFCLLFLFLRVDGIEAVYNPSDRVNNRIGIHILFTHELEKASKLINSSGGDWGYVTIPIQYGDRDLVKWQKFMYDAHHYHVIPILRIATDPYYKDTSVWRKPTASDIQDFANFLNSLEWPTQNRYVILFNEVNRFDEWQGETPNPKEYADLVSYAIETFKQRSPDFFLITAGMDNAAPSDGVKYLDNLTYLQEIGSYNSEIFRKIDGISSHSYPNPGFSQPPHPTKAEGPATFIYEKRIVESAGGGPKSVFITETGWDAGAVGDNKVSQYLTQTVAEIWGKDDSIVAITPFLLESAGGPFDKFTFYKNGNLTPYALAYRDAAKLKGEPPVNKISIPRVPLIRIDRKEGFKHASVLPAFNMKSASGVLKVYFKTIFGLEN